MVVRLLRIVTDTGRCRFFAAGRCPWADNTRCRPRAIISSKARNEGRLSAIWPGAGFRSAVSSQRAADNALWEPLSNKVTAARRSSRQSGRSAERQCFPEALQCAL
jgi:hypothetical protein